jgi:GNAT superfamily N-acetyltransferase
MIRLARAEDVASITDIVNAAYSVYLLRIGKTPGPMLDDYAILVAAGRVHVLDDQGQIAGLIVLIPEGNVMLLDNVAVSPQAQGRGFGMKLIAFAEAQARAAGCNAIRLYTQELMTENLARYRYLGFVETHRGVEKGLNRVYMTKRLAADG